MDIEDEAWRRQPLEGREGQSNEVTRWNGAHNSEDRRTLPRSGWITAVRRVGEWAFRLPLGAQIAFIGPMFWLLLVTKGDADGARVHDDTRSLDRDGFVQFQYSEKPRPIGDEEVKKRLEHASQRSATSTDSHATELRKADAVRRKHLAKRRTQTTQNGAGDEYSPSHEGRSAGWYEPGGKIVAKGEDSSVLQALPIGTRFAARLEVGVSSASVADVVARVQSDVYEDKRLVMRKGDVILGRASPSYDDARLMLNFSSARIGKQSLRFSGYAVGDGKPGITAERHGANSGQQNESNTADSVVNFARDLVGLAASERGPVGQSVDRNLVQKPLDDVQRQRKQQQQLVTLTLPAGLDFEVIVSG